MVYPFSFSEFKTVSAAYTFNEYLKYGGMPFLSSMHFEPAISKNYLQDAFNSVMLKDIVKRNKIRDVDLLERIIFYALANVGRSFSATSISKFFKSEQRIVAPETILNYLKSCEEAYLLYRLKSQDINGKKMLKVNEKYYVVAHGLRDASVGSNLQNVEIILKNIVGLELLRRGYKVCVGCVGKDNYPKLVLYKESSFKGNYEGIPALNIEDWLLWKNEA